MSGAAEALLALIGQTIGTAKGASTMKGAATGAQAKAQPFAAFLNAAQSAGKSATNPVAGGKPNETEGAEGASAVKAATQASKTNGGKAATPEAVTPDDDAATGTQAEQKAKKKTSHSESEAAAAIPAGIQSKHASAQTNTATAAGHKTVATSATSTPTSGVANETIMPGEAASAQANPHAPKKQPNAGAATTQAPVTAVSTLPASSDGAVKPKAAASPGLISDDEKPAPNAKKSQNTSSGTATEKTNNAGLPAAAAGAASHASQGREQAASPQATQSGAGEPGTPARADPVGPQATSLLAARPGDVSSRATPQGPATHTAAQTAPVHMLAMAIAQRAQNGATHFEIRMDPPELGRVEVRLHVSRDGDASATLTVEKPETLDLLARDQRTLHRALADLGLNVDGNALNFRLKDGAAHEAANGGTDDGRAGTAEDDEIAAPPTVMSAAGWTSSGLLDLQI